MGESKATELAQLIDCGEVARRLGIGRTKTFQMMASGDLPAIRIGRCVRVPVAALDLWVEAQLAEKTVSGRRLLYGTNTLHGQSS